MITDALVNFIPIGVPLSLVAGAGVPVASGVLDLLGQGVGTAPQNIIGNATVFGEDAGIGGLRPQLEVLISTALVTANAATLNIAFQAAVDQGVAGGYQPGTWQTLVETGPIAVANLGAGVKAARFDFPPAFPENLNPRYLRLLFTPPAGTNFTAGAVQAPVTMVRDDQSNKFAAANYKVA